MFTLTNAAATQIQRASNSGEAGKLALRVTAKVEADGSVQYGMGFDHAKEDDIQLDQEGMKVIIAPAHEELLLDTVLDYVEVSPGQFNFMMVDTRESAGESGHGCGGGGHGGCGGCGGGGGCGGDAH